VRSDSSTTTDRDPSVRRRVSDARLKVALPCALAEQLRQIAEADAATMSTTARRLLSRAVAREFALSERTDGRRARAEA